MKAILKEMMDNNRNYCLGFGQAQSKAALRFYLRQQWRLPSRVWVCAVRDGS